MPDAEGRTLAGIALFHGLEPSRLQKVEDRCRWHMFHKDDQIIDREDDTSDVYFIVSGTVRVVNYSLSGREVTFEDIRAGSIFGELAALDGRPRSANVVSLGVTVVATMNPAAFQDMLAENPDVCLRLMRRLAQVVRVSTERIMDLSTLGANNRVYAEILRLAQDTAKDDSTAVIEPIPIHGDIASRVSTTRETVARVFGDLTKKELIERKGQRLLVRDVGRLEHMVHQFKGD